MRNGHTYPIRRIHFQKVVIKQGNILRYVLQRYDGSTVNIFINTHVNTPNNTHILQITQEEGDGHWLMEAMVRNKQEEILQNQLQKVFLGTKPPHNRGTKPKRGITFKYQRKGLGSSGGLKQECNVAARRKTNSRWCSELKNRQHGGNYFDKFGTGGASGRIWCLIWMLYAYLHTH